MIILGIAHYEIYLKEEKKMAGNTVQAYIRDIKHFEAFVGVRGVSRLSEATNSEVVAYLMSLKQAGRSKSTENRKLASIRTYYTFLQRNG